MLQVLVPQTPSVFKNIAIPGLLFAHFKSNIKTLVYHTKVFYSLILVQSHFIRMRHSSDQCKISKGVWSKCTSQPSTQTLLKLLKLLSDLRLKPQGQVCLMEFILDNKWYRIGIHEVLFCWFTKSSVLGLWKIQLLFSDHLHSLI